MPHQEPILTSQTTDRLGTYIFSRGTHEYISNIGIF